MFPYGSRQYQRPYDVTKPYDNWILKREGTTDNKKAFGYSDMMAHEWGHCLFQIHSPPKPSPGNATTHDAIADGYCVMSYCPMEGHYCGKCTLGLRGWTDVVHLP